MQVSYYKMLVMHLTAPRRTVIRIICSTSSVLRSMSRMFATLKAQFIWRAEIDTPRICLIVIGQRALGKFRADVDRRF